MFNPAALFLEKKTDRLLAHGCHARLHQEACDEIYYDRIKRGAEAYNFRHFGDFGSALGAVACFFDQPWSRLAPGLIEPAQAWLLSEAAYCLRALARLTEALEAMRATFVYMQRLKNWQQAAGVAHNLSELGLTLGEVPDAVRDAEEALVLAERSGAVQMTPTMSARLTLDNQRIPIKCRTTLADALHQAGRRDEALTHFREAEQMQAHRQPEIPFLYSFGGFLYCDLLLGSAERAVWQKCLHPAETPDGYHLATSMSVEMRATKALKLVLAGSSNLFDVALNNLMIGRALQCSTVLANIGVQIAESRIGDSVDGLRRAGTMHELPRGLLTRAWVRFLEGDSDGARADLDEAWDIAERGPMRLHLADIHLHRARLFFREKEYPWREGKNLKGEFVTNRTAADDLAAAEKLINDCGYHRRDEELADAKRAILGS